jgi:hypothetical protein
VGCHEHRTLTPRHFWTELAAQRRAPSKIKPIAGVPDVFDFPRDIQPILDRLCVDCHGYEETARGGPRAGKLILTGDRGPWFSHSYYMLTIGRLFTDGRNQPRSNYDPRTLGSSASRLLQMLDGSHHDVQATPHEKAMLRLWIESGAAYPGARLRHDRQPGGEHPDQHRRRLARHAAGGGGHPTALRRLP